MKHLIVASHAHFSQGLLESLELVFGAPRGRDGPHGVRRRS